MSISINGIDAKNININNTSLSTIMFNNNKIWSKERQKLKALPTATSGLLAVTLNNEIHVLGGNNTLRVHLKWNGSDWETVSTLPYDIRANACAVVYNDEIHLLGGGTSTSYSSQMLYHYKWNGSNWSKASNLPYYFYRGSAVVQNNEIHILSSNYNGPTGQYAFYHYSWNGSSWRSRSTLPANSISHQYGSQYNFLDGNAVTHNNNIYILGSYDLYEWDGASTWNSVAGDTREVSYATFNWHNLVSMGGAIHIVGESSTRSTGNYNDKIFNGYWSYNLLPYRWGNGGCTVWENGGVEEIVILGGNEISSGTSTVTNKVSQWNGTSWI